MNELKFDLKKTILGDLGRLPQILYDKASELLLLKTQLEEVKFSCKLKETTVMRGVEAVLDENGKPKYSNVSKRQTETDSRLKDYKEYGDGLDSLNNTKIRIDNLTLQHQFCKDQFSAAKAMSRLVGGD